ncbi:MAG: hypothetical protein FJ125_15690, partial [Deltaproteobacteria bacterium]|nr:hypothetical protein [Deltaproteobacteria bacterium]
MADPLFGCRCFDTYRENVDCTGSGLVPGATVALGTRAYSQGQWMWLSCQARACAEPYQLQGTECVQCKTPDQCLQNEDWNGCLCVPWECPPDELICRCEHDVCTSFQCGPEFCKPANGCAQSNPAEFEASCGGLPVEEEQCAGCHAGIEVAHVPYLTCSECHGGNPRTMNLAEAHVAKPSRMERTWNVLDPATSTYFNYLTHVGVEG